MLEREKVGGIQFAFSFLKNAKMRLIRPSLIAIQVICIISLFGITFFEKFGDIIKEISGLDSSKINAITSFLILTLLVSILDALNRFISSSNSISEVNIFNTEGDAYQYIRSLENNKSVERVDLLQVSGFTALDLLDYICSKHASSKVRLLLLHDSISGTFDKDPKPGDETHHHPRRAEATISKIRTLKSDFKSKYGKDWQIEVRYYKSHPGVCLVNFGESATVLGWYRTFFEADGVIRVRSHEGPTIIVRNMMNISKFWADYFEKVWETAQDKPD